MRIGLVAGEASGDLLGAGLIKALREHVPLATFEGVAGPAMQAAGCSAWEESEALAVMGLVEPLKEIPRLLRLRSELLRRWTERPPDVFVGIDAPDFNLGLEHKLKRRGIRTVHYVSPTVWAWRQSRVHKIGKATDLLLCLLPFEKEFFDVHDVAAEFVGHRMADQISPVPETDAARRQLGIEAAQVVAVMPGSRNGEVSRLGPVFAEACSLLLRKSPELKFVAPMASVQIQQMFASYVESAGVAESFLLVDGDAPRAIAAADVVMLASGTATLQAALIGRAMVVAYKLAPATYAIAKLLRLVKSSFISLPNLLAGEALVPELVQHQASPESVSTAVASLLADAGKRAQLQARFGELRHELARGADECAAQAVLAVAALK
jgi:lipid-A-disaccharide synthase